jgi:nicotinamide-nucleotide amidase
MIASIVTVGDELLNGQTIDTNSAWLGEKLNEIGVTLTLKLSVGDTEEDIINGLTYASSHSDIILMTGGLGPTKDDITKVAIAKYLDDEMVFSEPTYERIKNIFKTRGRKVLEAHKQQCYMPGSAELVENPVGTAPGMWMRHDKKIILSMPGVPREMKQIMTQGGLDKIAALVDDVIIKHYIIQTAGVGETTIADMIEDIVDDFPPELSIAYLPSTGSVKLRLTAKTQDERRAKQLTEATGQKIVNRLGNLVYGIGPDKLAHAIGRLCKEKGIKIATAESCTGGGIGNMIVSVPGSSAYYEGSLVTYSNELKNSLLNVSAETIKENGAVSEETVKEMIAGLAARTNCDAGVAVSGIAGPGGGTADKPVGTIWIATGNQNKVVTRKLQLVRNRKMNIDYTITLALNELRLFIEGNF